jgi:hypothetical protein
LIVATECRFGGVGVCPFVVPMVVVAFVLLSVFEQPVRTEVKTQTVEMKI